MLPEFVKEVLNCICVSGFTLYPHISDENNMIGFTRDINVSRSVLVEIKLQVDSLYTLPTGLAAVFVSSLN